MTEEHQSKTAPNEPDDLDAAQMWFYYYRYPYLLAKVAFFGAILYGIFLCLQTVGSVLLPLLVSLLLAYLLDPTIDWFEERGIDRTVAIIIFILLGGAGLALFVLVLYPTFATSLSKVIDKFPQIVSLIENSAIPWVENTLGYQLPPTIDEAVAEYRGQIEAQIPSVAKQVTGFAGGLLSQTGAVVASILNLVMIPIFTFYFLRDFDKMRVACIDFIPESRRDLILDRIVKMDSVVGAWFRGQINVALILAGLYAIGLGAVFGFSGLGTTSGVAVGLLTGLLNIIPYFGMAIGIVLSVLLVLIDFAGFGPLVGVIVVFVVVQLLEGYVITPKIVGEAVGLSPVVVIIVLLLGGEVLGLMGVLLAIPIAGVVKVLLPDIIHAYRTSPFFTGDFGVPEDEPGPDFDEDDPPERMPEESSSEPEESEPELESDDDRSDEDDEPDVEQHEDADEDDVDDVDDQDEASDSAETELPDPPEETRQAGDPETQ